MKKTSYLLFMLLITFQLGCSTTSQDLTRLSIGMSKAEVIAKLGTPHSVAADGNLEILIYYLDRENMGGKASYFVRLIDGNVKSFGEKGDFDSTVTPKNRIELEIKNDKGERTK